jgi:outer membrane protein
VKRILFIISLIGISFLGNAQTAAQRIGYVDSEEIFKNMPEAIMAQGEIEAFQTKMYEKLDSMSQSLQQAIAEFRKQESMMSETIKADQQQRIIAQNEAFEQAKRQASTDVQKRGEQLLKPVKDKVYKAIEEVAKSEKMTFVFDKLKDALLLYADNDYDITFKVLDKLKRAKK